MACASDEHLLASALESLDIDNYWSENSTSNETDEEIENQVPIILQFYYMLLEDMVEENSFNELENTREVLRNAISHVVHNYSKMVNVSIPGDLDYNSLINCLGYLHRYAAFHASLVYKVLYKVFHITPPAPIRKILSLKDTIDVVSLGGGPGNDLLGFCSALYGKHMGLMRMNLTVIDKAIGWETIFFKTTRMLQSQKFGKASDLFQEIQIIESYIQADLTKRDTWTSNLCEKLENADILLLVKVLSVLPSSEKDELLEGVVSLMKPGALLVYIDCLFPTVCFYAFEKWLDCIYKSHKIKFWFDCEVERFGYANITPSQSCVQIYKKKFIDARTFVISV